MSTRTLVASMLVGLMALAFAGCQNNKQASMCDPAHCDKKECRDAGKCMGDCKDSCEKKCDMKAAKCDTATCGKKDCCKDGKSCGDCAKCCGEKCDMKAAKCDPAKCDKKECRDAGKCMGNCDKACAEKCEKTAMGGPTAKETVAAAAIVPAAAGATTINTICPIGGHKLDGDAVKMTYKTKTIGFCCPDCIDEMNKMSEAQRDEVLAKASKK